MFGRLVDWIVLAGSLTGLALTGAWTVYGAPNSADNLQNILQLQAENVLSEGGHDWAQVTMDGQHARLTGQSPNVEAVDELIASFGGGQLLTGPITRLTSDIVSAPPISPYVFEAENSKDRLILRGHVPSRLIKDVILAEAETLRPGNVDDQLRIGTGQPLEAWKETVIAGLKTVEPLHDGHFKLIDSDIYLSGEADSGQAGASLLSAYVEPIGAYSLQTDIRGPALWEARLEETGLVLQGGVSSETQKTDLLSIAQSNFRGSVRDDMRIIADAPEGWDETAKSLLPEFANFQSGRLRFSPEQNGFLVEGRASGSVQAYLQEDMIAGAFPVGFDIETVEADLSGLGGLDFENAPQVACQDGLNAIMAAEVIRFETSKATISRESGLTLDKIVSVAGKCENLLIEVHGHTDSAGSRETNIVLSKERAASVVAYMIARGISVQRLDAVGFGPDVPIADNETASGRAANRRIEFKIVEEG